MPGLASTDAASTSEPQRGSRERLHVTGQEERPVEPARPSQASVHIPVQNPAEVQAEGTGGGGGDGNQLSITGLMSAGEISRIWTVIMPVVPFLFVLLLKSLWDRRLGLCVGIGLFVTTMYGNDAVIKQVRIQERRNAWQLFTVIALMTSNIALTYHVFSSQDLHKTLFFQFPELSMIDIWMLLWVVGITDFVIKFGTIGVKSCICLLPRAILALKQRGRCYLAVEEISQFYRSLVTLTPWTGYLMSPQNMQSSWHFHMFLFGIYCICKLHQLWKNFVRLKNVLFVAIQTGTFGSVAPSKEDLQSNEGKCPICQDNFSNPVKLQCTHVFCDDCVCKWFDRDKTCPMCRASIASDPTWRDGSTKMFPQLY